MFSKILLLILLLVLFNMSISCKKSNSPNNFDNFDNFDIISKNRIFLKDFYNNLYLYVDSDGNILFNPTKYTPLIAPIGLESYPLEILDSKTNLSYKILGNYQGNKLTIFPSNKPIPSNMFQVYWNGQNIVYGNGTQAFFIKINNDGTYYFLQDQYNSTVITSASL